MCKIKERFVIQINTHTHMRTFTQTSLRESREFPEKKLVCIEDFKKMPLQKIRKEREVRRGSMHLKDSALRPTIYGVINSTRE